jgi:two-component system, OmpR family, sensor histidine kinase MprB
VSFRARLTLFSAAGIALVLIGGSVATYLLVRDQLRGQVDASLREQSAGVVFVRSTATDGSEPDVMREFTKELPPGLRRTRIALPPGEFGELPVFAGLIDGSGENLAPNPAGVDLPVTDRALKVARTGSGAYFTDVTMRGTHMRLYVSPAEKGKAFLIARSLSEVDTALGRLAWGLAITCVIGIVLAALVGALVARGALRPVRRLTATAERITHTHDLGERIDAEGQDEIARLGASFNAMLDSLDGALRSQRQLVSDASHELRTPLTSLRTNIDLLRQGPALSERDRTRLLRDLGSEVEELTTLVANLVDLARGSQRKLHLRPVRLDEIACVVVERAEMRFASLEFRLDADESVVLGDPEELDRALWNLVENAAKWSREGGSVEVTVAEAEVAVRDYGPGVPAADRPHVFDRFYRSEAARSRPGSGLGLAIVRQIAESHGGRVEVVDAEGGGACFRLSLVEHREERELHPVGRAQAHVLV